ncbi:MAG: arylsulfatase [Eubacteriales bacterium]|nr:arylsulfatase [Clostridiales bacterium]MDD2441685.1 arylsulfatase [Eubacteriales bacterium]MDD4139365.1 arylsulfatase [Eubacteriales bacterium]MDD4743589.1 arylsulfatase [Eubacteriales bacterium]
MEQRPNVLLIMMDQLRWDCLGCSGNPVIETPNIDFLARNGSVFRHAYTPSPSCIPARACLISGLNPWHTGVLGMGPGQGEMGTGFNETLPGVFARHGYHTQGVGKMHFYPQRALNGFHNTVLDESGRVSSPGFVSDYKQWFDANKTGDYELSDHGIGWNSWMARPYALPEFLHPSNWTASQSVKFLKERDPTRPFFLMTSFARPHSPYDPPPYYFDLYDRQRDRLPEPFVGDWADINDRPEDAADPDAWRGRRSHMETMRARAGYYGSVSHADHQIGKLFNAMRRQGLLDNTIVLFTSDHGDMLGDHHLWRKTYAYEGSAHIPLVLMLPKPMRSSGIRHDVDAAVTLTDIMPTLLDLAGLPLPADLDGRSLRPLLLAEPEQGSLIHLEHCTCYSEEQEMQCLTDGQRKYIWFPRADREQFFDLSADPREHNDLAAQPEWQEEIASWRRLLVRELEKRQAGLVEDGHLVCQRGKPSLQSPYYAARVGHTYPGGGPR